MLAAHWRWAVSCTRVASGSGKCRLSVTSRLWRTPRVPDRGSPRNRAASPKPRRSGKRLTERVCTRQPPRLKPAGVDLQGAVQIQELLANQPPPVALRDDAVAPAGALAPVEQGVQEPHVAVGGERLGLEARRGQHLLGADAQLRGVVELGLGGDGRMQRQLHGDQHLQVAHPKLGARTQRRIGPAAQELRALQRWPRAAAHRRARCAAPACARAAPRCPGRPTASPAAGCPWASPG